MTTQTMPATSYVKKLAYWPALLGAVLLGAGLAGAGRAEAQRPASPPALTAGQWREDLRYLARELERRHKNLFHTVSRDDFTRAVAALDSAIPSLQPHEVVVRMLQLTALVGDGHTRLHVPAYFRLLPVALQWFGADLRVLAAAPDYRAAVGARVVGIGDLSLAEAQARVVTCFPSAAAENEWYVLNTSPAFLVRPEILHALGIIADPARVPVTFQGDDGHRFTLELLPIEQPPVVNRRIAVQGWIPAAATPPLFRQRPGEPFWFRLLPDSQTVYVSFRGYQDLGEHAYRLFQFLDRVRPARLIIDVRQNGGGDFYEGRKYLIEPLKRRPDLLQKGRLYLVVGRATFSAALANAVDFRNDLSAILVGEPIGERPNSYSENDEMTLPKSRIVVSYSTRYYRFVEDDGPAVMPDVRIDPDWEAFRAGRDAVTEWILGQRR